MHPINILLILLIFTGLGTQAQRSQAWLEQNDRGNRYEGIYAQQIDAPVVEVLGFRADFEAYEFGKGQELNIAYFQPEAGEAYVSAEELRVQHFYWMQSKAQSQTKPGWQEFGPWPVDQWLKTYQIPKKDLGITVALGDAKSRKFSPAIIYHSNRAARPSYYFVACRIGKNISGGTAKVYRGLFENSAPKVEAKIWEKELGIRQAGGTFPIIMLFKNLTLESGWHTLTLAMNLQDSGRVVRYTCYFYHPEFDS